MIRQLSDPQWRIRNLYSIKDKEGRLIKFVPNEAQEQLLCSIHRLNVILKARQRGFSTLIQLMGLDTCIFNENQNAGVIAQDLPTVGIIFREKVKFAWDHLPPVIREMVKTVGDSKTEMVWSNGSSFQVATSLRSGTYQFEHVSEFGKICAEYPHKAREVVTGTLPALSPDGIAFIESTAEGREGAFFDICQASQKIQQESRKPTKLDFRFHFYSWWDADEYALDGCYLVTDRDNEYFDALEQEIGRKLSVEKRQWYVATRQALFGGDNQLMRQEYPSTPEEAFEQSMEGCYFTSQMLAARKEGRIGHVPYLPGYPVNTFWDIGARDGAAVWFHQHVNGANRFIRFYEAWDEPYSHFVAEMQKHGYVWGKHYLPHDAEHRRQGQNDNKCAKEMLEELGLSGIEVVPRVDRKILGIQQTRNQFPTYWIDSERCESGIKHLDQYRKEWDTRLGRWKDEPRHDIHSEAADALRQHGQGFEAPNIYREVDSGYYSNSLVANPY